MKRHFAITILLLLSAAISQAQTCIGGKSSLEIRQVTNYLKLQITQIGAVSVLTTSESAKEVKEMIDNLMIVRLNEVNRGGDYGRLYYTTDYALGSQHLMSTFISKKDLNKILSNPGVLAVSMPLAVKYANGAEYGYKKLSPQLAEVLNCIPGNPKVQATMIFKQGTSEEDIQKLLVRGNIKVKDFFKRTYLVEARKQVLQGLEDSMIIQIISLP
jgi:hypothetical protein